MWSQADDEWTDLSTVPGELSSERSEHKSTKIAPAFQLCMQSITSQQIIVNTKVFVHWCTALILPNMPHSYTHTKTLERFHAPDLCHTQLYWWHHDTLIHIYLEAMPPNVMLQHDSNRTELHIKSIKVKIKNDLCSSSVRQSGSQHARQNHWLRIAALWVKLCHYWLAFAYSSRKKDHIHIHIEAYKSSFQ